MPGRRRGSLAEQGGCGRLLHRVKHFGLLAGDAVGERLQKSFLRDGGEAVMFLDSRPHRPDRKFSGKCHEVFSRVGCPRGDIDQRRDLGVGSDLAEDGAAPGMGSQHRRTILQRQYAACSGDRICQRVQRILYRGDLQPCGLQQRDHLGPTGAVGPGSVDQHNVACFDRRGRRGVRPYRAERCREQARGQRRKHP